MCAMTAPQCPTPLSRRRAAWLDGQTAAWVRQGLVDADVRDRILSSYEVQSAERRGLLALVLLGALMFGIGVLLLIGYNWDGLPVTGKIAIIMASVALAFAASAVASARQHPLAAETLAFIGVLLHGNAIWLIAQVLHIRGNLPDAFLWWAIGGLICAWLVGSRAIGIAAAVLLFVSAGVAAGQVFERPVASFVVVLAATIALAYRQKSRLMLGAAAAASIAWACWLPAWVQPGVISVGAAALMGCAFFAIGTWHRPTDPMGRAWQVTGLIALVVLLVPLLVTDFHSGAHLRAVTWRSLAVIVPSLLVAATLFRPVAGGQPDGLTARFPPGAQMIVAAAVTLAIWLALLGRGIATDSVWVYGSTLAFSLLALGLSVSSIRTALDGDRPSDLTFGVLFALAFLLVRWASLIDSMLWSGVMLLAASGGFFAIARLWQGRHRRRPTALRPAPTGVA
jgi:uncharacterized membrane protein